MSRLMDVGECMQSGNTNKRLEDMDPVAVTNV